MIGPRDAIMSGATPPVEHADLSPWQLQEIAEGRKFLYVWGWARYFDIFKGTPEHVSRACWALAPNQNLIGFDPTKVTEFPFHWGQHTEGNRADEESG